MEKLRKRVTGALEKGAVREGIAYLFFGGLTTLVDYVLSVILYYQMGVATVLSQVIAWVVAVLFAFATNKWWVFNSRTLEPAKVWAEFVSFVACRLVTFLFNVVAMAAMVDWMGIEFFVSKILISVVVIVLNYVFSKALIFTKKKES